VAVPIVPIRLGDVVRLKKGHPCGANAWQVTKLGMDIGLACQGCGRKVRLERYEFDRRFRGFLAHGGEARHDTAAESGSVASDPAPSDENPTTR
jgi:hypothetical protein